MAALENAHSELRLADKDWEDTFNSITDMISIHDKDYNIVKAKGQGKNKVVISG
ncbi:MAG: hypothetical protein ACUZ8A_07390 [Candidatus Bathyanammoxibius sp.]